MDSNLTNSKIYRQDKVVEGPLRKSSQSIMPWKLDPASIIRDGYNIYPATSLGNNKIFHGFHSLASWIIEQKTIIIDGYAGVFWDEIQYCIDQHLFNAKVTVTWVQMKDFIKPASAIESLVRPFLGMEDSVWGTKCLLALQDFYNMEELARIVPDLKCHINIVIGTGAALSGWDVPVIYIDLPKNELQFRMRAGSITNLGANDAEQPFYMYKRFYFVDWVLLNAHKKRLLPKISVIADGQRPNDINWMFGTDLTDGLDKTSCSVFRVRPWFEPGAWGGQWIKNHISNLNTDVVNYAWSFELIVPENGLVFESDGYLLEVSFDFLMFHNRQNILGKHAELFGDEFPIRFDFLDTFNGGNLSIQCHPSRRYIQEHFGETITQDETYYILDCQENARVYLGFQEGINPEKFKDALQASQDANIALNMEDFVQSHPAQKHDLFLIPNQTIHSAGAGNLVLEISATPYIFTFKMYDWLRLDLDGNPRPINIEHAFHNLDYTRKGASVQKELISTPAVIEQGDSYQVIHLPTHPEHFYDVHRIEFDDEITVHTNDSCQVLMLVEGVTITIETIDGIKRDFAYAETFVVPAATKFYVLRNAGSERTKVIKAFLK